MLPVEKTGIPQYYVKVTRALKGTKDPNIIYNVGGGVFIHVLANPEDIRDYYVAVEPSLINSEDKLLDELELRLADYVKELEGVADPKKRFEMIMDIVNRVVVIGNPKVSAQPKEEPKKEGGG